MQFKNMKTQYLVHIFVIQLKFVQLYALTNIYF